MQKGTLAKNSCKREVSQKTKEKCPKKHKNDTLNDTLNLISENKYITAKEIKDELGFSISTAKRRLRELQEKGIIVRKNGKRNGYWKIIK